MEKKKTHYSIAYLISHLLFTWYLFYIYFTIYANKDIRIFIIIIIRKLFYAVDNRSSLSSDTCPLLQNASEIPLAKATDRIWNHPFKMNMTTHDQTTMWGPPLKIMTRKWEFRFYKWSSSPEEITLNQTVKEKV